MPFFSVGVPCFSEFPTQIRKAIGFSLIVATLMLVILTSVTGLSGFSSPRAVLAGNAQGATSSTTTTLLSSLNPSYFTQSSTLTATVTSGTTGTPTGTVTFLDGTTQLGQVALGANGQAQFPTSALAVGSHSISAQYGGDANFGGSSGVLTQVVNTPPALVSITVTPNNPIVFAGDTQQFTATGQYGDGSTLDLTNSAAWASSDTTVATFNSSGLAATALAAATNTTATYSGVASPAVRLGVKSHGGNIMFLGGGSSAMFLELGQAAQSSSLTGTPCVWTNSISTASQTQQALVQDNRPTLLGSLPISDVGDIWVTWSQGTGTCGAPTGNFDIYAYTSLDSAVGVKCYFEVDSSDNNHGCVQSFTVPSGTAGDNKLCNTTGPCVYGPDTPIPAVVVKALHKQHWSAVGTDIMPEDARYAALRMFTPCNQAIYRQPFDQILRQTFGLGYQGPKSGLGVPIQSAITNNQLNLLDFNFQGNDPINATQAVRPYSVTNLGAKPILIVVSPAGGTGIGAATDIPSFVLSNFTDGTLGRSTDLLGPTTTASITTLISEPLSGPYNVMEYSITNSSQFHSSQDIWNCAPGGAVFSNGMKLLATNGVVPAFRVRALGTDEMISQIQAATPSDQRMGYFYWSAANAASFTTSNGKYLTVNGVDPIQTAYTDGVLPGVDAAHPLSNVTFNGLNSGDYPIWSVLRILSKNPTPIGVTALVTAAQAINATQHNFVSPANLNVWHSHYYLPAVLSNTVANGTTINTPGDLCAPLGNALPEFGGDAGGANILRQANLDFCMDYQNPTGLVSKTN